MIESSLFRTISGTTNIRSTSAQTAWVALNRCSDIMLLFISNQKHRNTAFRGIFDFSIIKGDWGSKMLIIKLEKTKIFSSNAKKPCFQARKGINKDLDLITGLTKGFRINYRVLFRKLFPQLTLRKSNWSKLITRVCKKRNFAHPTPVKMGKIFSRKSTKNDGSWKQKSKNLKYFLFHTTQALTS